MHSRDPWTLPEGDRGTGVDTGHLEIRLLGPVVIARGGRVGAIGGPRIRALLALLALEPGMTVGTGRLIDELWAGEPPDGAEVTLRSYVSRLRAALGDEAPIRGGERGYAISLKSDQIDSHRFERLARTGLRSLERRRYPHAGATLRRALAEWRGQPFSDLPHDGAIRAEAVRLEELRAHVLEARIEAELESGRAGELVDELERLVTEFPYRERFWRHLMLALYRAGRQADALAAYHRARSTLDADLGIEPGSELRELEAAVLRQSVPPPAGSDPEEHADLPVPLSSFVGRRRDVADVARRVVSDRLVTLVGVGGVGKTRLAIEAARVASSGFADGAVFVDLAAVADPTLVDSAIATALGVRERPGESLGRSLSAYLRDAELLLVLDNCEHLRAACAATAATHLRVATGLRILATSREVLDVPGEIVYPVPPLGLPGPDATDDEIRASEAVELLLARAAATRPGRQADVAALRTAERICRDLDGLPLAIELAAARTSALSLEEIADRLRDRFRFLVSWRRLSAARHQTLRAAMDWSFELLGPDERRVLGQLSVFAGSFDRRGVAAVCLGGDEEAALRYLERLIQASLVVPVEHEPETRYRLLETVRQYAAEQVSAEETDHLRRRHARFILDVVLSANLAAETRRARRVEDHGLIATHLPGIRAALAFAIDADAPLGLEIACGLERFWVTNSPREGIAILTALLTRSGLPETQRARGYRCRGGSHNYLGQFDAAVADYQRALAIHQRLGDDAAVAHLQLRLAIDAHARGDPKRASELVPKATDTPTASPFEADIYVREHLLALLARSAGRSDAALEHLRTAVALATEAGDAWWRASVLEEVALLALETGRVGMAGQAACEALDLSRQIGDRQGVVYSLALSAWAAAQDGEADRAGRIWGALEAELERGGPVGQWELEQQEVEDRVRALAGSAFETDRAAGRALPLDGIVDEILTRGD